MKDLAMKLFCDEGLWDLILNLRVTMWALLFCDEEQ
jgi:hypothetical protein